MEIKVDRSRILMSDVLKGNVPELESEAQAEQETTPELFKPIIVVMSFTVGATSKSIVGILGGVHFEVEPQIQLRVDIGEAFDIVEAQQLSITSFELHHGERIINIPGPFMIKAARIDEVLADQQLCTLGLHLKKLSK